MHTKAIDANNIIRRQENEKFTYHRHNAWVGYRYSTLLQYVEQFAKKSKTCLCKQNRRHCYVNNRSSSFILYNTNRVLIVNHNTRFVFLFRCFKQYYGKFGKLLHDTCVLVFLKYGSLQSIELHRYINFDKKTIRSKLRIVKQHSMRCAIKPFLFQELPLSDKNRLPYELRLLQAQSNESFEAANH